MGVFDFFSSSTPAEDIPVKETKESPTVPVTAETGEHETVPPAESSAGGAESQVPEKATGSPLIRAHEKKDDHRPVLSATKEHDKKVAASDARAKRFIQIFRPSSKKRAQKAALVLRTVIVGPTTAKSKVTPAVASPKLNKIRAELSQPKTANKIIAQLRTLPASEPSGDDHKGCPEGPIHAVCLAYTDAEEDRLHFSKLADEQEETIAGITGLPAIASVPLEKLRTMFNDLHIIDLVKEPDLGIGQPGDGKGILAGAVPTAETVIKGFEQITPQLMALGYATGKAIIPNHVGVNPPLDRMSVLTYWWGLELLLPPPTMKYLGTNVSITNTVVNFLTAMALVNDGVREILPFVRYISQFIDFEWDAIKKQDKGQGVVCAATWIMPAAMVPRPWDFPPPAAESSSEGEDAASATDPAPADVPVPGNLAETPIKPSDAILTSPTVVAA
ncbi:hypothetical protein BDN72DRAFT_758054 [Pluteus cervinus]|uniref:Uncharacterized protein n=1 Tax=Pluteus cervinus TaxID=181527 RepID=A0ACD3BC90_9AGAR|nr:hypothetical protein BDN72DRAFT_758054 [Pluteus cervinus]